MFLLLRELTTVFYSSLSSLLGVFSVSLAGFAIFLRNMFSLNNVNFLVSRILSSVLFCSFRWLFFIALLKTRAEVYGIECSPSCVNSVVLPDATTTII